MNADIIFIEGAGSAAESAAVAKIKKAFAERGLNVSSPLDANNETLTDTFNAALARSNVIAVVGGIGADKEDKTVKTVADILNEDCEINFSALGRIASGYARSGEEMPESATNAALTIKDANVILNAVGIAVGCAVECGSQYILLLPGNVDEVSAMLTAGAGEFLDKAVGILAYENGDALEFSGDQTAAEPKKSDSGITFNPAAVIYDDAESVVAAEVSTDVDIVIEADEELIEQSETISQADDIELEVEPDEVEDDEDLSATVIFDAPTNSADEAIYEPASEPASEPVPAPSEEAASYVVLTPSKDNKAKAEPVADGVNYIDLNDAAAASEQEENKTPVYTKILKFFIPWKGDGFVDILRKTLFYAAIIGLVVSSCYIGDFFYKMSENNQVLEEVRAMYDRDNDEYDPETRVYSRYDGLLEQNEECIGWITVPNTKIDNPVYQSADNDYYLTHNNKNESSVYGAIFADYRNSFQPHGNSQNIVLYGHHMKDGTMFADLHKYKKMSFYKENPVITFDTKYGQGGQYKVIACMITNSDPADDNGYFFDFAAQEWDSDLDFNNWKTQIERRSLYTTPVDILPTDEILTLSTCTYEIKDSNLLCVVVARKVRDGEPATVNTINTSVNSQIIYPAVWYETFGGQRPAYADGLYTWVYGDYNRENINANANAGVTSSNPSSSGSASSGEVSSDVTSSGECLHEFVEAVEAKLATCTEDGYTEGEKCSLCGATVSGMEKLTALGHKQADVSKKDPTCTEPGHEAGVECERCHIVISGMEEIPATGHTEEEVDEVPASCGSVGYTAGKKCSVCDTSIEGIEEIPATGEHNWDGGDVCVDCQEPKPVEQEPEEGE